MQGIEHREICNYYFVVRQSCTVLIHKAVCFVFKIGLVINMRSYASK
jgi:hypothetical protein